MELSRLRRRTEWSWVIEATGPMRVPVVIFGGEALVSKMDQKAWEQASNVAALPGIQESVLTTQRHWVDCLRNRTPPQTSGADNLKTFALCEAAYASAASGDPVAPCV